MSSKLTSVKDDAKKTSKLQLEMSNHTFEKLKALKDETHHTSYSAVISQALALYENVNNLLEDKNNRLLVVNDETKEVTRILLT